MSVTRVADHGHPQVLATSGATPPTRLGFPCSLVPRERSLPADRAGEGTRWNRTTDPRKGSPAPGPTRGERGSGRRPRRPPKILRIDESWRMDSTDH